jgi:hypothetical protein
MAQPLTLGELTSLVARGFNERPGPQSLLDMSLMVKPIRSGARDPVADAVYAGLVQHADNVRAAMPTNNAIAGLVMFAHAWATAKPWIDTLDDIFMYMYSWPPAGQPGNAGTWQYLPVRSVWALVCTAKWVPPWDQVHDVVTTCRKALMAEMIQPLQTCVRVVVETSKMPSGWDMAGLGSDMPSDWAGLCKRVLVDFGCLTAHVQGFLADRLTPLQYLTRVSAKLMYEYQLVATADDSFRCAHMITACRELVGAFARELADVVSTTRDDSALNAMKDLVDVAEQCRLPKEALAAFRQPLHDSLARLRLPTDNCRAVVRRLHYELLRFDRVSYLFGSIFLPSALRAAAASVGSFEQICASAIDMDILSNSLDHVDAALRCARSLCDDQCLFRDTLMNQASRRMLRHRLRLDLEERLLTMCSLHLPRHRGMVEDLRTAPAEQRMYADSMIKGVTITVLRGLVWPRVSPDRASVECLPQWMTDLLAHHESLHNNDKYTIRWYDHSLIIHDTQANQRYRVSLLQACLLLQFFNDAASAHSMPALLQVCPSSPEAVRLSLKTLKRARLVVQQERDGLFRQGAGLTRVPNTINLDVHVLPAESSSSSGSSSSMAAVEVDKRAALQAALARVLKARRTCPKPDLLLAAAEAVQQYFKPTGAEVEHELAALIDRDYASLSSENIVSYVA